MLNKLPINLPEDYQNLHEADRQRLDLWIQKRLIPLRTPPRHGMPSSYELKHIMERENKLYVTNGQFKGAMQKAGYKAYSTSEVNWLYRVKVNPREDAISL